MVNENRITDWLVPVTAVVILTLMCIASVFYLPFWFDEILTHYVVGDPSFTHMLGAESDLINPNPPLYFIVTWPVAQIFGAGELPLRLLSSIGVSLAVLLQWHLLRKLYGAWPAAVAVVAGFFASQSIWYQNMEARFYGMYLSEVAAAVSLAVAMMSRRPIGWPLLAANTLIHAALVTTHYFGFLYSGAILAAVAVCSMRQPRVLFQSVGSIVVGWLAFVPCVPIFLHHLEFSKPHGWISTPTLTNLLSLLMGDALWVVPAAAGICAMAIAFFVFARRGDCSKSISDPAECLAGRRVLAIMMLAFSLAPVAIWAWSQVATPVFVARYFIPDVFVVCFLLAEVTRFVFHRAAAIDLSGLPRRRWFVISLKVICSLLIVGYLTAPSRAIYRQLKKGLFEKWPDAIARIKLPAHSPDMPIVFQNPVEFLVENYYSTLSDQCVLIVDRAAAVDENAGRGANNLDQVATALKRNYSTLPILTTTELLRQFDRFIVLDEPWLRWYRLNIQSHSEFQCESLNADRFVAPKWTITPMVVQHLHSGPLSQRPVDWRRK